MTWEETQERLRLARQPKEKKVYKGPKKVSDKRAAKLKEEKEMRGDTPLDKWFEARRADMTGKCQLCGGVSEKRNDETYRRSIHHLLDKRPIMFPSVALHEDNWLELCHFGNSCHDNIHNRTITWELLHDSAEWPMIVEKFKKIYPFIAEAEKKNIPEQLLKEIK